MTAHKVTGNVVTILWMNSDDFSVCDNTFLIKEEFSDGRNWYINFGVKYYITLFPDGFL